MWPTNLAVLVLVACGIGPPAPEVSPTQVGVRAEGVEVLRIGGSEALVAGLLPALGSAFERVDPGVRVTVRGGGSAAGVDDLLNGQIELAAVSREATPSEDEQARVAGWSFFDPEIRHIVGVDVVAVAVNELNRIDVLTYDQVIGIFCSGSLINWSQLGGADLPITALSREPDSGTQELFEDFFCGPRGIRADVERANRARVGHALANDPGAISFVSLSENAGRHVALAPEPDSLPIAPSQANVIRGSYPLYHDVVLYSRGRPTGPTAAFLEWVASPAGQEVVDEQRFVPLYLRPARLDQPRPLRETVQFDPGATEPNQRSMARLHLLVAELRDRNLRHVVLEGYADASEQDPLELSRQRAAAVQRMLADELADLYFEVIPRGPVNPIAPNDTPYGRLRNRRVQVYLGEEETQGHEAPPTEG